MDGRERLILTLKGETPDRVPVSLFVQEEFLSYMYPGKAVDRVTDAVACAEHFDFDLMARSRKFEYPHFMRKSFPNWELSLHTVREAGNFYKTFEIQTPLKKLKQVEAGPDLGDQTGGVHLTTIEYLIKDESDLEAFIKYAPALDQGTVAEMVEYCAWAKQQIGSLGLSVPWTWGGIFNQASTYRDVAELMMDPYINPGFYVRYMDKLTELSMEYSRALARANGDAVGIQGNIANSAIIGEKFFDQFILPYEKRLVEAIHQEGSYTVYHNCGRAEVLQTSYVDMGLTAWETIAAYPQGDNDLQRAKENVGKKLTLIGNLDQIHFLKTASEAELVKKVEEMLGIGKPGGRYIFACSDFLEVGTPFDNVITIVQAAKRFGNY
ncbi:uroporphyrinogen decarboxylase [Peptococcaceae bacterium CEB3]|nr:uroporphyrinogen decarboxylase [Peptococcaceae bacterium CEB3]